MDDRGNPDASTLDAEAPPRTLEDVLLEEGVVTPEQLREAQETQAQHGGFLGQILVDMRLLKESSLTGFLIKHCRVPHLSLLDYLIDPALLELIPESVCQRYCLLPLDRLGRTLTVAMVNPLDAEALAFVRQACPSLRIKPILCALDHFQIVSRKLFQKTEQRSSHDLTATSLGFAPRKPSTPPPPPAPVEEAPEVVVDAVFAGDDATAEEAAPEPAEQAVVDPQANLASSGVFMKQMFSVMRDSMHDTYAVLARRVGLFEGLSPADVAKLFSRGVTREFEQGQTVFQEGAPGDSMFVILSGSVQIVSRGSQIALLHQDDIFGEMAMAGQKTRSAEAVAAEASSVLEFSNDIIRNILNKDAAIRLLENIIIRLGDRLHAANEKIERLT